MCMVCERGHESEVTWIGRRRRRSSVSVSKIELAAMLIPVNHQTLLGDFTGDFQPRGDHEDDSSELHHARMADSGSGEGSGEGGSPVSSRGNGGCIRDRPVKVIPCPRCQSMNTKFCYYNNYSVNQPRHFCRNCQRYWTVGGTLRNVPVGGGSRKKTRTRSRSDAHPYGGSETSPCGDVLLNASSCMQQLSMLPPSLGGFGFAAAATGGSQLPFLQFALEQGGLFQKGPSLAGLQEVPDLQSSFYDIPQVPQLVNSSPMVSNNGFFLPEFSNPGSDPLATKASLWASSPVQQLQALTGGSGTQPPSWEDRPKTNSASLLQQLSGYELDRKNPMQQQQQQQPNATVLPQSWASKQAAFWDISLLQQQQQQQQPQRPMMHNDRLVPHTSWDDSNHHHRNVSPNGSNITTEDSDRCLPTFGYHEDVVSQPWVGLQASDILFH